MPLKEQKYKFNQTILKLYGYGDHLKLKVITMKVLRTAGVEDDAEYHPEHGSVNDCKLEENIRRAKSKIFEYATCNLWDWFFTATLDKNKQDRTDLELFHKQFTRWLRNYKRRGAEIKFLVVPELHFDGVSWHLHGFLQGLPVEHLRRFQIGDRMGKSLAAKVSKGEAVYDWPAYAERFGFCDLEPIRNPEAASKYIMKYISKGLASSVSDIGAHLYYHSRGLKTAEVIKKGTMWANIAPSYENEYCSVAWLDYSEQLREDLESSFS